MNGKATFTEQVFNKIMNPKATQKNLKEGESQEEIRCEITKKNFRIRVKKKGSWVPGMVPRQPGLQTRADSPGTKAPRLPAAAHLSMQESTTAQGDTRSRKHATYLQQFPAGGCSAGQGEVSP